MKNMNKNIFKYIIKKIKKLLLEIYEWFIYVIFLFIPAYVKFFYSYIKIFSKKIKKISLYFILYKIKPYLEKIILKFRININNIILFTLNPKIIRFKKFLKNTTRKLNPRLNILFLNKVFFSGIYNLRIFKRKLSFSLTSINLNISIFFVLLCKKLKTSKGYKKALRKIRTFKKYKKPILDVFNLIYENISPKIKFLKKYKYIFSKVFIFLFPLFLSLIGNAISLNKNDDFYKLVFHNTGSFIYGLIIVILIFLIFINLFRKIYISMLLSGAFILIASTIDYLKKNILETHFLPWDIYQISNLGSFRDFLTDFTISKSLILSYIFLGAYCTIFYFLKQKNKKPLESRLSFALGFIVILQIFATSPNFQSYYKSLFSIELDTSTDQNSLYETHGFITAFALNLSTLNLSEPQNYNEYSMERLYEKYKPNPNSGETFQNPDIIVILSESFWDPTVLKNVRFSDDPIKNYREIAQNNPSGKMVSPTFGGGTVRPEFEILTGLSTSALPSGNVPYQQYVNRDIFSYPRFYKNLGYDTLGIHTYQKTFYERSSAYPFLGIDEMLGENDFNAELHWNSGPFITDDTIAEEIIYQLEQPHDVGLFLMAITMENHGLYRDKFDEKDKTIKVESDILSKKEINPIENFAKGVSDSDKALETIYNFVMNRKKPTIVLWYGDHLPTLGEDFVPYTTTNTISSNIAKNWSEEEKYTMFSTPYVIFTNYDTGKEFLARNDEYISPYFLPALMADFIDAPECFQTNFLLDMFTKTPVISKYYKLLKTNTDKKTTDKILEYHEKITYDALIGEQYLNTIQKK